jgi:hypothetical protein
MSLEPLTFIICSDPWSQCRSNTVPEPSHRVEANNSNMPKILTRDPAWLATGTPGFDLFQGNSSTKSKRVVETQYEGPQRKIAHRGTEVFVAVGNELRWSEVGLLKDAADDNARKSGRGVQQEERGENETGYRVSCCHCSSALCRADNLRRC